MQQKDYLVGCDFFRIRLFYDREGGIDRSAHRLRR